MSLHVYRPPGIAIGLVLTAAIAAGAVACGLPAPHPLTIAATASSAEPQPWSSDIADLVVEHVMTSVQPGDGAVDVLVAGQPDVTIDLTPMRGQEVEQLPDKAADQIAEDLAELEETLRTTSAGIEGVDALALLDRGLRETSAGGTLLLITSGVSTENPLDLRQLGGWAFDRAAVVADLDDRGLIPDATGIDVVFAGLADVAGTQPGLTLPARAAVGDLWMRICQAAGAVSCRLLDAPLPPDPAPVAALPVPPVAVAAEITTCQGSAVFPSDIGFQPESAVLSSAADEILVPLAAEFSTCPTGRVATFIGHTARIGGTAGGFELSTARAGAVRSKLAELGVPARVLGSVVGRGDTMPLVDNLPNGVFDEALASINRRVEIVIEQVP